MSWKKFIVGEEMPDKGDPKYRERYEREVEAGRKFAKASGISWSACKIQMWGNSHKVAFVVIVFGIVILCFFVNLFRLVDVYQHRDPSRSVAVASLDSVLQERMHPHGADY